MTRSEAVALRRGDPVEVLWGNGKVWRLCRAHSAWASGFCVHQDANRTWVMVIVPCDTRVYYVSLPYCRIPE